MFLVACINVRGETACKDGSLMCAAKAHGLTRIS